MINYEYPPIGGGAGNETFFIAKALNKMNHNVSVITSKYKNLRGLSTEESIKVYRIWGMRKRADRSNILETFTFLLSGWLSVGRIIRKEKAECVVVFFSLPCGPLGLYIKKKYGLKYLLALQGGDVPGNKEKGVNFLHNLLAPLRRKVLKEAAAVAANSKGLKELSEKTDPVKVDVVYNGIDTEYFRPQSKKKQDVFTFLFVGRFQKQKNLFALMRQIARLRRKTEKRFKLTMVGDGPQKKQLEEMAKKENISDIVEWQGWRSKEELRDVYASADCFINPSFYEGMPNTVLEAMACGLPVIASDVIGNNEIVKNNYNGLLFDLRNEDEWMKALDYMLNEKHSLRIMGESAREFVAGELSWDKTAEKYIALLKME